MKPIHWRRSKLGKYLRHLPRRKHIKGTLVHRLFGDRLFESELWHPTRQRFASGMALGAFFALMPPLPFQMLGAGIIAYITRVNVPAAMTGTWISNPFTTPFIVYIQYRLGCLMMGRDPIHIGDGQLLASLTSAPLPYLLGILPSATIIALVSYPLTLIFWDAIHSRIEAAKKRKARNALHDALPKKLLESAKPDGHCFRKSPAIDIPPAPDTMRGSQTNPITMAIAPGTKAPEFTLKTITANGPADYSLSANLGKKNTVILFFPLAFTGVCTQELCDVTAGLSKYESLNAEVVGISVDSPFAQDAWAKKENIKIPLLSDLNKETAKAYGVLLPDLLGFGSTSARAAFVIDKEGVVRHSEQTPTPKDLPDFNKIAEVLASL